MKVRCTNLNLKLIKIIAANHLQSPRSLFMDSSTRETLSSRRPSFNPAMITNNTLDRSLSSPFYSGNTMFGGSNAANLYRSNSVLTEASQVCKKKSNLVTNYFIKKKNFV